MPRADPADPQIKAEGSSLPKGAATQINEATDAVAATAPVAPVQEMDTAPEVPISVAFEGEPEGGAGVPFDDEEDLEPLGEDEDLIFGPTDIPDEPPTAGMSYGPGGGEFRLPGESPDRFLDRMAAKIAALPEASPDAKLWALRRLAGE